jgi:hypothetical protein
MSNDDRLAEGAKPDARPGPFLARVVSITDPYYMGTLEVELLHESGNDNAREGQVHQVKYLSPFAGSTSVAYVDENNEYNSTQKSYGMWMVPPDIGNTVVVIFIDGDPRRGFWIGCVPDPNVNFMVPGYAATSFNVDGDKPRTPVAEYNKKANDISAKDTTRLLKPFHPFLQDRYLEQGLLEDDIRGITTSSARREIPSAVFGISTPGPIDKKGPRGKVGKFEHAINEAFISRVGGSSFVMDDGDDKFLRKKSPSEGPPEYAAVEQDETDGDVYRPHNELLRFRTRTGHQILLHNTEDLIYIGNARGTSWIEMTSDGKIDIYAEDSVSLHTKQDLNFYADRDINMEAGRNFNTKVAGEMHTHVVGDQILIVDANQKIHIKAAVDITYDTTYTHHVKEDVNILFDANYLHYVKSDVDWVYDANWKHKVTGQVDWNFQQGLNWDVGGGSGGGATVNSTIFGSEVIRRTGNIDYTVVGNRKITTTGNLDINTGGNTAITAGGSLDIKSGGDSRWTGGGATSIGGASLVLSAGTINLNGPAAPTAVTAAVAATPGSAEVASEASEAELPKELKTHSVPNEEGSELTQTIMRRIPTHEPWPHHENLDPVKFKPDQTDRDIDGRNESNSSSIADPAELWKKYTTVTDTFAKISGASEV